MDHFYFGFVMWDLNEGLMSVVGCLGGVYIQGGCGFGVI